MIGKVMTGRSFGGVVNYILQKQDAVLLAARGIRIDSLQNINCDFNLQRKINRELGKAVGHIALSWSIHDKYKLTPEIMAARALEYMELMDIKDTQYLIVQHNDKPHLHLHIIYNRVSDNGKTISDRFQKQRNGKVTKDLTLKYGYYLADSKEHVHREQLKGSDRMKYELYDIICNQVKHAISWKQLEKRLKEKGIEVIYKYKSGTQEIQGISFSKDGIQLKGSQIDRSLSYGNIDKQLTNNSREQSLAGTIMRTANEHVQNSIIAIEQANTVTQEPANIDPYEPSGQWFIEDLAAGFAGGSDSDDDAYKKRKRNKEKDNDNQISR